MRRVAFADEVAAVNADVVREDGDEHGRRLNIIHTRPAVQVLLVRSVLVPRVWPQVVPVGHGLEDRERGKCST